MLANSCVSCKEIVYFDPRPAPLRQGHISSHIGRDDFANYQWCEFCLEETRSRYIQEALNDWFMCMNPPCELLD